MTGLIDDPAFFEPAKRSGSLFHANGEQPRPVTLPIQAVSPEPEG